MRVYVCACVGVWVYAEMLTLGTRQTRRIHIRICVYTHTYTNKTSHTPTHNRRRANIKYPQYTQHTQKQSVGASPWRIAIEQQGSHEAEVAKGADQGQVKDRGQGRSVKGQAKCVGIKFRRRCVPPPAKESTAQVDSEQAVQHSCEQERDAGLNRRHRINAIMRVLFSRSSSRNFVSTTTL